MVFSQQFNFSKEAVLNPNETCEIPNREGEENSCLVFDLYQPDNKEFIIGDKAPLVVMLTGFQK